MKHLVYATVAALFLALANPQSAKAGNSATFPFKNASAIPIIVVMDTNREVHTIAPGGAACFVQAGVGDIPTFRCYLLLPDGQRGPEIANGRFATITIIPPRAGGRDLTFDGSSRVRD